MVIFLGDGEGFCFLEFKENVSFVDRIGVFLLRLYL